MLTSIITMLVKNTKINILHEKCKTLKNYRLPFLTSKLKTYTFVTLTNVTITLFRRRLINKCPKTLRMKNTNFAG